MAVASIQDRTAEFRTVLGQVQKRQASSKVGAQRRSLLTDQQKAEADGDASGRPRRSEFARKAAEIGRGISGTMGKLEKLAQLAKRKTLFDDRPVEINELTFIIKQDLAALNQQISGLQGLTRQQHPKADQVGEHNKNVVFMLQGKLTDVSANFKDVLELRTKNIQASRARTDNFISTVSQNTAPTIQQSASPLYGTPNRGTPSPGGDTLSLNPMMGDQQLLMMEEAQPQNAYIQQRGEAIESIEKTIAELGSIFGQLASMVSEQSEQIQRIDANTEDVVDNVQGAQKELLKYWSRVSSNRWLIAKMFGVLMIFFLYVPIPRFYSVLLTNESQIMGAYRGLEVTHHKPLYRYCIVKNFFAGMTGSYIRFVTSITSKAFNRLPNLTIVLSFSTWPSYSLDMHWLLRPRVV